MSIATVAVPVPLRHGFDYRVPPALAGSLCAGTRVRVPFGRREIGGLVLALRVDDGAGPALREIIAAVDARPLLGADLLDLCQWAAEYYRAPIGEVIAAALPARLRGDAATGVRPADPLWRLTDTGRVARPPARALRLHRLLDRLAAGPALASTLASEGIDPATRRRAAAQRWIETVDEPASTLVTLAGTPPVLTAEQAGALAALRSAGTRPTLLHGVTGSGKTEVYLQLAAEVLAQGRQVLVLAPEIGLTPQLAERFTDRFGAGVVRYHSGLGDGERSRAWWAVQQGRARIVVGTRSAVWLPLATPGLVIVDEEHDGSYRQQDGFRYSARDLAVLRAQRLGIPVVLGSATPSLESLQNAATGRYGHVRLTRRVGADGLPPRVQTLDVRHRPLDHGLSTPLLETIGRHLAAKGQALVFLNRRGWAPVFLCRDCGWVMPCPDCDARLVLHRGLNRMACHHCGHVAPVPRQCPDCGGRDLAPVGAGTERIEDALRLHFPAARIERFDSDRLRSPGTLQALLDDVRSGAIDVLVGTQVLAKGHDFPRLSLAALVDVDQALYGADFRAIERMGQLLTQVAGRAGRRETPGEVLLQTHHPEHPLLRLLIDQGHEAFAAALLEERRAYGLPPFGYLALLRAEARDATQVRGFFEALRRQLPAAEGIDVLGPVAATMARRAGHHRQQILLRADRRGALQAYLAEVMPMLEAQPVPHGLRWSVDVDPGDLF